MKAAALQNKLESLETALGYAFSDPRLLEQALTHRSFGQANNERLEFLGDAVLSLVVANDLFVRFDAAGEGELSRFRAGFVRQDSLAQIARDLRLGVYLRLGSGEAKSGGAGRASILADALEAVIGAVMRDGGFDAARAVALRLLAPLLDTANPEGPQKDPKTRLQEVLQSRRLGLPDYRLAAVDGPGHEQAFSVLCLVERLAVSATGSGPSRRAAEQDAAARVLELLGA